MAGRYPKEFKEDVIRALGQRLEISKPEAAAGVVASPPCRAAWPGVSQSFFALLQKNVLNRRRWETRDQLRIAFVSWIERTYHRHRRQEHLGRLTPVEYELIMTKAADQAA